MRLCQGVVFDRGGLEMTQNCRRCRAWLGAISLTTAVLWAALAGAAQPPKNEAPEAAPPPKREADPTIPSPALKELLPLPKDARKTAVLHLKGRVVSKQMAVAILDIDGAIYMLPVDGEARSVKVLKIAGDGVTVQVTLGGQKEIRVLH
jgi:hypothetical protein